MSRKRIDNSLSNNFPLWELVPCGLLLVDEGGKIQDHNQLILQSLGYADTDIKQQLIFQINPRYSLLDWKKLWKRAESGESIVRQPSELITRQGKIRSIFFSFSLVSISGQTFGCCIIDDAINDPHFEEALALAATVGPVGTWQLDLATRELRLDNAALQLLGLDTQHKRMRGGAIWTGILKSRLADQVDELKQTIRRAIDQESAFDADWGHPNPILKIRGIPKRNLGQLSGFFGLVQALETNQIQTSPTAILEPALDQAPMEEQLPLALLTKTLDHVKKPLLIWFNSDGALLHYNASLLHPLGYTEEQLAKMSISQLCPSLDVEDLPKVSTASSTAALRKKDGYILDQKGQQLRCSTKVAISTVEGEPYYLLVVSGLQQQAKSTSLEDAQAKISQLKDQLRKEKIQLQDEVSMHHNFQNIISKSKKYKKIMRMVGQVAATSSTVLITGETGTGKELLARAIHSLSERSEEAMVRVNCAALPQDLIESELFGHEKGAFTGAFQSRIGRFELADKGTIFLDEVGELSLEVQAKLLRVLQEGEFERVGSTKTQKVDVRVIAATNRDLEDLVEEGAFRMDLYYRLNIFPIHNIPLRERREDILPLVQHFVKLFNTKRRNKIQHLMPKDLEYLMAYEFPGNIRELQNIIERAMILSPGDTLNLKAAFSSIIRPSP